MLNENYLAMLQAAVQQTHKSEAVHRHTYPVREFFSGEVVWDGHVELFELIGHAASKMCYAWISREENGNVRYVTVLESAFVDSPVKAVRSAIFTDAERPKQHRQDAA